MNLSNLTVILILLITVSTINLKVSLDTVSKIAYKHRQEMDEQCFKNNQAPCGKIAQGLIANDPSVAQTLSNQLASLNDIQDDWEAMSEEDKESWLQDNGFLDGPTADFWTCEQGVMQTCAQGAFKLFKHKQAMIDQACVKKKSGKCMKIFKKTDKDVQAKITEQMENFYDNEELLEGMEDDGEQQQWLEDNGFLDEDTAPFWTCELGVMSVCSTNLLKVEKRFHKAITTKLKKYNHRDVDQQCVSDNSGTCITQLAGTDGEVDDDTMQKVMGQLEQLEQSGIEDMDQEAQQKWLNDNGFMDADTAPFWTCEANIISQCTQGEVKKVIKEQIIERHAAFYKHQGIDQQCVKDGQGPCKQELMQAAATDPSIIGKVKQQAQQMQKDASDLQTMTPEDQKQWAMDNGFMDDDVKPFWTCEYELIQGCMSVFKKNIKK